MCKWINAVVDNFSKKENFYENIKSHSVGNQLNAILFWVTLLFVENFFVQNTCTFYKNVVPLSARTSYGSELYEI